MSYPLFSVAGMEMQFIQNFSPVWTTANDYYNGQPGSFWEAVRPDSSWKAFGSLCVPSTDDPSGSSILLLARNLAPAEQPSPQGPPLVPPSGFKQVWNDHGTGNTGGNGACWQIIAPSGYTALGSVFNNANYNEPDPGDYVCLRNDFVSKVGAAHAIWNDQNSGATCGDLQCYAVSPAFVPPCALNPDTNPQGIWAIISGSFMTLDDYCTPWFITDIPVLPNEVKVE